MTAKDSQPPPRTTGEGPPPPASPAGQPPQRPWRTEGLPKSEPPKPRRRWIAAAVWLLGYLLFFGILTVQDRLSGPQPVPYTEFKSQVANKNVGEVFARGDSIEGQLKKAAPLPGQKDRTYQQFTTERPTFASDDLLAELTGGGATVRATPLVQQRGFLTNLLISFGSDSPARRLLRLDVQAPAGSVGWTAEGQQTESRRSRVGPRHVRRCRRDRGGGGGDQRGRRLPQRP